MDENNFNNEEIDNSNESYNDDINLNEEQEILNIKSYEDIMLNKKKKKTVPFLNKYEKARLLGVRRQQLANGAQPKINTQFFTNINDIVDEELKQRKIPIIIQRKLPDGYIEEWKIEEFLNV